MRIERRWFRMWVNEGFFIRVGCLWFYAATGAEHSFRIWLEEPDDSGRRSVLFAEFFKRLHFQIGW